MRGKVRELLGIGIDVHIQCGKVGYDREILVWRRTRDEDNGEKESPCVNMLEMRLTDITYPSPPPEIKVVRF